jgi:hypothetical protein
MIPYLMILERIEVVNLEILLEFVVVYLGNNLL